LSSDSIKVPDEQNAPRFLKTFGWSLGAGALGLVIGGLTGRLSDEKALLEVSKVYATPSVKTIQLTVIKEGESLTLPGSLQAFNSAPIYARVNGYLKRWLCDIGDKVRANQVLAEIETPDLDQQLEQGLADLETAKAHANLAELTSKRWKKLLQTDSVSPQEVDEKNGDFLAKRSIVAAAQANVDRLKALQSFKRITSPFDGVVTTRNTDIGALINAGQQSGKELFTVADQSKLRLYVNVPQIFSGKLKTGLQATLDVPEHPGRKFIAKFIGDSKAVNEASGSVLIQLIVDNKDLTLRPGDFANVVLTMPASENALVVPSSVLIYRKEGQFIATLSTDNKVILKKVEIARDLGNTVQISSGITTEDEIIDVPPDSIASGDTVRPIARQEVRKENPKEANPMNRNPK
jgi:RND family efflux transporter MFP subunit